MREPTIKKKLYVFSGDAVIYNPASKTSREVAVVAKFAKRAVSGKAIIAELQKRFTEERVIDFRVTVEPVVYEMPLEEFCKYATAVLDPLSENTEDND